MFIGFLTINMYLEISVGFSMRYVKIKYLKFIVMLYLQEENKKIVIAIKMPIKTTTRE